MKITGSAFSTHLASPLAELCDRTPAVRKAALVTLFSVLTALAAQVSIRILFMEVPFSGQVLMALLAGGLLGPRLGALSQVGYLLFGAAGLPVFAVGLGGVAVLVGPTGGYLVGFVAAAWLVGMITRNSGSLLRILLANTSGVAVIYFLGWVRYAGWLSMYPSQGGGSPMLLAFMLGIVPFIWVDLAKIMLATQAIHAANRKRCVKN